MAVGKLSGGEQSRLLLAQLMLREAQVLVLDEPTNDLDLPTLAVLEESLTELRRRGAAGDARSLLPRPGRDHDPRLRHARPGRRERAAWFRSRASRSGRPGAPEIAEADKATAPAARRGAAHEPSGPTGGRKKLGYIEQREYDVIEATIAEAEAALAAARAESEHPEHASDGAKLVALLAAVEERQAEVDRLYARWAELEAKLNAGA